MLSLALALMLGQAAEPTPPPVEPAPEPPPEARVVPMPEMPPGPSPVTRSLLSAGGGSLGGPASLAIALLLIGQNPNFDPVFATGALSSLLITGIAFSLHQALGGGGEITLSFLGCALAMAGAAGLSLAIDPTKQIAPYLTVAIGSIPAAVLAVVGLEGTTPKARKGPRLVVAPNGVSGTF